MKIQSIQNTNTSFGVLNINQVDIDHVKKFIDPIRDNLEYLAKKHDIFINGSTVPVYKTKDYVIGDPSLKITVKPLIEDRFEYLVNNLFIKKAPSISTNISINELNSKDARKNLLFIVDTAISDLKNIEMQEFFKK